MYTRVFDVNQISKYFTVNPNSINWISADYEKYSAKSVFCICTTLIFNNDYSTG